MNAWRPGVKQKFQILENFFVMIFLLPTAWYQKLKFYRSDSEKQEGCGEGAHERLIEPQVTMQWLLAKPMSFSNIPAFLDLNGN